MNAVTQITREEYVAIISFGGKAFAFSSFNCGVSDDKRAAKCLLEYDWYDKEPDKEAPSLVYYALTE